MLKYKDYLGHVEFDDEAGAFHGEVVNTRDVVTFEGRSVEDLEAAFREPVDDYLAFCAQRGEEPNKPFSGRFVVRLPAEEHRRISIAAKKEGTSLNSWVADTLRRPASG